MSVKPLTVAFLFYKVICSLAAVLKLDWLTLQLTRCKIDPLTYKGPGPTLVITSYCKFAIYFLIAILWLILQMKSIDCNNILISTFAQVALHRFTFPWFPLAHMAGYPTSLPVIRKCIIYASCNVIIKSVILSRNYEHYL